MARILSVVWYKVLPARFGGQKGIAGFNQFLSEHHEIICICSKDNDPVGNEPYQVLPVLPVKKSQVVNLIAWNKIIAVAKKLRCTHVIIEHPYYGLLGMLMKRKFGIKLIIHSHNIEARLFKELGRWWWPVLARLEKATHRHADLCLFKTPDDLNYALINFSLQKQNCIVVPYGLAREKVPSQAEKLESRKIVIEKHRIVGGDKLIMFNGTLDYPPNANAVSLIVEKLIPILLRKTSSPFKIIVCGRLIRKAYKHIQYLHHENYIYAGFVENIEDYFLAADIFINPVWMGGGMKVKVMDALSYNLHVISTTAGSAGIDKALCGDKLITTSDHDWETFCDQVILHWDVKSNIPAGFFTKYNWKNSVLETAERINRL